MALSIYAAESGWVDYSATPTRAFPIPTLATERVLVVLLATRFASQITGITYAGLPLTRAVAADDGGNRVAAEVWYRINPPTGSANIVVTCTSAKRVHWNAFVLAGANQTAANLIGDTDTNTGNGTGPSITLTSAVGEMCLSVVAALADTDHSITTAGGQTQWSNDRAESGGPAVRGATSSEAGATSTTMSYTIGTGGSFFAHAAVAFKPSAGGGGPADTEAPDAAVLVAFPEVAGAACTYFGTLPSDPDTSLNWSLRRAADDYPATNRSDGTQIASGSAPPGSQIEFTDTSRTNGDPDFARLFLQDAAGNWNLGDGTAATYCYPATRATLEQRYKSDFTTTVADGTTEMGPNGIIVMQMEFAMARTGEVAHAVFMFGDVDKANDNAPVTGNTRTYDSRVDTGRVKVETSNGSDVYRDWAASGEDWGDVGDRKVAVLTQEAGGSRYGIFRVQQPETTN